MRKICDRSTKSFDTRFVADYGDIPAFGVQKLSLIILGQAKKYDKES